MKENIIENNIQNKNSKERKAKLKLKEYFTKHEKLTYENFNQFLEFIGLREIWSNEKEQNYLWETITSNSIDKQNIDYDTTLLGISSFFEEDDGKDINDIYDETINQINIKHINLDDSDNLSTFDNKKNIDNERCIDEFLNTVNNNQETLYNIRFINEIFFSKNNNDNNIDQENKINDEKIRINSDIIIDKIKTNYKFINISIETLNNYLKYIEDINNINKNENENYLNRDLINYVNAVVDLKIEDNNKNHNINLNNSNITNNNINGNSIEFSIEKLSLLDNNIINCLDGILSLNSNIDFIKLIRKYIENYILYLRQSIYNDLKSKELELQQKINQSNNTCNKCSQDIEKENKKLNVSTFLLRKNSKYKYKLNKELGENKMILQNKKNSSSTTLRNSLSMPKESKRKYTQFNKNPTKKGPFFTKMSTDNLYIFQTDQNNENQSKKRQSHNGIILSNKSPSPTYSSIDGNIEDITYSKIDVFSNNGNVNGDQFLLETTKLYNDNIEDENISNKNNYILNSHNNSRLILRKRTNTKSKIINYNVIDTCSDKNNDSSFKINIEDDNLEDYDDFDKNSFYSKRIHNSNAFFLKKNLSTNPKEYYLNGNYDMRKPEINAFQSIKTLDNCYGTINYGPLNDHFSSNFNKKYFLDEKLSKKDFNNFYDFKYLGYSHRVKNLFLLNNEKLNLDEFFSDGINVYFSKSNKQNCELIINCYSFYFLKPDSLELIIRINIKLLETILISTNNFNLLQLSFKDNTDIIIESLQRMEILIFLQKAMVKRNLEKEIQLIMSNKFYFRKKNGKNDSILTFKNKMFNLTPNFENAQKIGELLKYQENIFSASFHKKLIVLCSIGLIIFNDNNYKSPRNIIPIIGTSIKLIAVQTNEKIYCLKLTTINDETYIFGSLKKKEILDWKRELSNFKKVYDFQMKQINPNYSRKSSKFEDKENEDIFSKKFIKK